MFDINITTVCCFVTTNTRPIFFSGYQNWNIDVYIPIREYTNSITNIRDLLIFSRFAERHFPVILRPSARANDKATQAISLTYKWLYHSPQLSKFHVSVENIDCWISDYSMSKQSMKVKCRSHLKRTNWFCWALRGSCVELNEKAWYSHKIQSIKISLLHRA